MNKVCGAHRLQRASNEVAFKLLCWWTGLSDRCWSVGGTRTFVSFVSIFEFKYKVTVYKDWTNEGI